VTGADTEPVGEREKNILVPKQIHLRPPSVTGQVILARCALYRACDLRLKATGRLRVRHRRVPRPTARAPTTVMFGIGPLFPFSRGAPPPSMCCQ